MPRGRSTGSRRSPVEETAPPAGPGAWSPVAPRTARTMRAAARRTDHPRSGSGPAAPGRDPALPRRSPSRRPRAPELRRPRRRPRRWGPPPVGVLRARRPAPPGGSSARRRSGRRSAPRSRASRYVRRLAQEEAASPVACGDAVRPGRDVRWRRLLRRRVPPARAGVRGAGLAPVARAPRGRGARMLRAVGAAGRCGDGPHRGIPLRDLRSE